MTKQRYETPEITVDLFDETDVIYASDSDDNIDDLFERHRGGVVYLRSFFCVIKQCWINQ